MAVFMKVNIFTNLQSLLIVQLDYGCGLREQNEKNIRKHISISTNNKTFETFLNKFFYSNYIIVIIIIIMFNLKQITQISCWFLDIRFFNKQYININSFYAHFK